MDILICGVGGQGTVMASRILGEAALKAGFQVRTSEIIGMSQREGSVVSQVRIGERLHGPLIPDAGADYFIGFELAEAARNIGKIAGHGKLIINTQCMVPPSVYLGKSTYNKDNIMEFLGRQSNDMVLIDAINLAREAGNIKTVSAVMLGAFSKINTDIKEDFILEQLLSMLPDKLKEINIRAFNLGKTYIKRRVEPR